MQPFYDRSEAERMALTERVIAERRTLHERWDALAETEAAEWNGRAALAARWLDAESGVLDLGCGTMALERHLPAGTRYYPSDVVARDQRTIVLDYNLQAPPRTGAGAVACLGVLEYLHDPLSFLSALAELYPQCVASYSITDAIRPTTPRRAHGWVNDFDRAGLEAMFGQAGWSAEAWVMVDDSQGLWRLRRSGRQEAAPGPLA